MTVGTVLLLTGIFIIIIGAITTALMVWFGFKRPKYRKEHFTARTTGTVERMSNFYSNDIRVPLVSYTVEGQTYKVAGPRFAGSTMVTFKVGHSQLLTGSSNITTEGELPTVVKMRGSKDAAQSAMTARYPVGKTVDVFYDPDAPKHAFVERDAPMSKTVAALLTAIGGALTAMGVVMAAIGILILTH